MSSKKTHARAFTAEQFYAAREIKRQAELEGASTSIRSLSDIFGVSEDLINRIIETEDGNTWGFGDMTREERSLTHLVGFAAWKLVGDADISYDPNDFPRSLHLSPEEVAQRYTIDTKSKIKIPIESVEDELETCGDYAWVKALRKASKFTINDHPNTPEINGVSITVRNDVTRKKKTFFIKTKHSGTTMVANYRLAYEMSLLTPYDAFFQCYYGEAS